MRDLFAGIRGLLERDGIDGEECGCETTFEDRDLVVTAADCPADGAVETAPACRARVVDVLAERDAAAIAVRVDGLERTFDGPGGSLLAAAGRFVERVGIHDPELAGRCRRDPLAAGRAAAGRAGVVADVAAETELTDLSNAHESYEAAFRPHVAPTVMRSRVAVDPPSGASLRSRRALDTEAVARIYDVDGQDMAHYHLVPGELSLSRAETDTLAEAHRLLAQGGVGGGARAPGRAVRRCASADTAVEALAAALRKHTRGLGVLEDCFADQRVSDVYATAPVERNPLRVVVNGESMRSNVRLTEEGAAALASRFRRESGRAFSRASPALDASVDADGRAVRVAGLTDPASDGIAFAFRTKGTTTWTLPALVANRTLPPRAAGLLSVAVRRSVATLVAGPRGAGKTSTLDALLWELRPETRVVVIEDTPELSVETLQEHGRDVQAIRTTSGEEAGMTPVEGLRTALRLGEGALVLGEVRGEEAAVLYEAMRVGADSSAVLGTIHGDGAAAVRERVVEDLGVPESSFAATDLVVTMDVVETAGGTRRRVASIEEVVRAGDGTAFEPLFAREDDALVATGRMDRGESYLLSTLAAPGESYADVRDLVAARATELETAADAERTTPADLSDVSVE